MQRNAVLRGVEDTGKVCQLLTFLASAACCCSLLVQRCCAASPSLAALVLRSSHLSTEAASAAACAAGPDAEALAASSAWASCSHATHIIVSQNRGSMQN